MDHAIPLPERSASTLEEEARAARREADVLREACAIYKVTNTALTASVEMASLVLQEASLRIVMLEREVTVLEALVAALTDEQARETKSS